jgi:hypothetical protein
MSLENRKSLLNNNFRTATTKSYISSVEKNYTTSVIRDTPKTKLKADIEDLPQVDPIIPTEVIEAIVEPVIESDDVIVPDVETPVELLEDIKSNTVSIIKNTSNSKHQKSTTE